MLIGVTGQIGAGKTTAAGMLAALGGAVVDADRIGREVVEANTALLRELTRRFGSEILTPSGRLRRKRLAAMAFASDAAKSDLNDLVHPYLLEELRCRLSRLSERNSVVIVDAALLLDWKLDREMDRVLMVHAGQKLRFSRLARRGISHEDAMARQRAQLPFRKYRRRADCVILNNTSRTDLQRKLTTWWFREIRSQIR